MNDPAPLNPDDRKPDHIRPHRPEDMSKTEQIFARHRAGDARAREDFYRHYSEKLLPIVQAEMGERLRGRTTAHDLVQEVLRKSLDTLDPFERGYSEAIMGLFRRLVKQVVADAARYHNADKRAARAEIPIDAGERPIDLAGSGATPSRIVARDEFRTKLRSCLQRLSAKHRRVLELRVQRRLSLEQTAAEFEISVDAVGMLEKRAKEALRACMEDDGATGSMVLG